MKKRDKIIKYLENCEINIIKIYDQSQKYNEIFNRYDFIVYKKNRKEYNFYLSLYTKDGQYYIKYINGINSSSTPYPHQREYIEINLEEDIQSYEKNFKLIETYKSFPIEPISKWHTKTGYKQIVYKVGVAEKKIIKNIIKKIIFKSKQKKGMTFPIHIMDVEKKWETQIKKKVVWKNELYRGT